MKALKTLRNHTILTSLLYVLLGIVLIIFPDTIANLIGYIFAILVLFLGIVLVVFYVREDAFVVAGRKNLTLGLILITAAIYCLIKIEFLVGIIPTVLGLVTILNGLGKLQNAFDLFRTKHQGGISILIMAIIVIAFGIILLINPFEAGTIFYILVGVALLIGGVTDIASVIIISKRIKQSFQEATAIDVTESSEK